MAQIEGRTSYTQITSDGGEVTGSPDWDDVTGKPTGIFSTSGEGGTTVLDNPAVVSALGYTPFDEQGGEIFGSVEIGGDLEVGGDVQVDGVLTAEEDVTVKGNLTVLGTEFIANTETVEISDNLAVINAGETGSGVTAGFAGWEVDRGTATDFRFGFDESLGRFVVGQDGDTQVVATREDSPVDTGLAFYNSNSNRFETTDQVTWDGSVLKVGTGSTEISDSDVDTGSILFDNNEQNDFTASGRLFWDKSAGLYIRSANANDGTEPRLQWSGDNFTAGRNLSVSYGTEDEPTVFLNDSVDLDGTLDAQGEVSTSNRFALRSGGTARLYLRIENRFGETDDTVELNIRDKTGNNVADLLRVDTEGSDKVDANLNWEFRKAVTLEDNIGTDHYAAQQTGWRVLYNGEADFREIYADELTVQTFTAELTQSLAGSDILTKSAADLSRPYVQGNDGLWIETPPEAQGWIFAVGDVLRLRVVDRSGGGLNVSDVWLEVTDRNNDGGDEQEYEVDELDAPSSYEIRKGARVLDYGTAGDTIIERTVNGPGSPFDRIAKWQPDANGVPDTYETISQVGNISDQTDADVGIYTASARLTDDIRIGDTGGSYLEFDGSLTIVTADHGDLDSAISTIQTDVSDNAASISAVASTQSDQGDAISALEIDVSDNEDGISSNASLISQLDTDLGNVESGLQTQIDANESDITSNLSLINDLETDTQTLSAGLELLTQTGQQNLLQYVLTESDLTTTYDQTGGNNSSTIQTLGTFDLDDLNLQVGDTFSYSFEGSFEDPQNEGGFVGPLLQFRDSNGDGITFVSDNDAPRGNRISSDTGGDFEFTFAEGIVIPANTASIRFYYNSGNVGSSNIHKARNPMLVRGETAVGFAYDQQALAAFNLSAENETGLASVEGRVTDNEATLDLTVSYDDQTAGIFLTADGDGTALELDADQILLSGSVTADSIAADTITSDEIAAGTITADEITVDDLDALNATIGGFDIANGSISTTVNGVQIALGSTDPGTSWNTSVRGLQVGANRDNRLWFGELANGDYEFAVRENGNSLVQFGSRGNFIEGDLLVDGSVTADAIAADTITADQIDTGTITADRVDIADLFAQDIDVTGTLTMASGGEITNADEDYTIDDNGIQFSGNGPGFAPTRIEWVGSNDTSFVSGNPDNIGLLFKSNNEVRVRAPDGLKVGRSSFAAVVIEQPSDTNLGGLIRFRDTFNGFPSDSEVRSILDEGQAAIGAVEFSDGNINLLWLERTENDNVKIDDVF